MKLTFLGTRGNIEARTRRHRMHSSMKVSYYDTEVVIDRDLIMEPDRPLTRGLRESMQDFKLYEEEADIEPIMEQLATCPQLEREP